MLPADGFGIAGKYFLTRDLALLDLRDAAFGDAHAIGHVLLGQPTRATYLGEPVPDDSGEQFLLAVPDRLLAAGPFDVGARASLHRV